MTLREELLAEIDAFCARTAMKHTIFGIRVMNDGKFVLRLRQGTDVTGKTVDRCRAFMRREAAVTGPVTADDPGDSPDSPPTSDIDSRATAARSVA